jgi:hypothetical protein
MCKFNVLLLLFMTQWKSETTYSKPSDECENKKISWFFQFFPHHDKYIILQRKTLEVKLLKKNGQLCEFHI